MSEEHKPQLSLNRPPILDAIRRARYNAFYREAEKGKFVSKEEAEKKPESTQKEIRPVGPSLVLLDLLRFKGIRPKHVIYRRTDTGQIVDEVFYRVHPNITVREER